MSDASPVLTAATAATAVAVAEAWNGPFGAHWAEHPDRYNAMMANFDDPLFTAAAIGERDHVLDVGCGSGLTTRLAACRAPQGQVTGVDISAPLLERARSLTDDRELPHVAYVLADAQLHPFPAGAYDVVISRGGVMFFADHVAAFANIARGVRPGGRLALLCPQPGLPDGEERAALGRLAALAGQDRPIQGELAAAMASFSEPSRIHEVLAGAGFTGIDVNPVTLPTCWGHDAPDAVDFYLSRTPGLTVPDAAREEMAAVLRPYESERGVMLGAGVWIVTARRPAP
ncbi:class I SAM-dependent methyltransferase [Streptomyces sp. NBC_01506]|uniref:class I SAM-dependent methyltransferase n=1 Tax=Streptomyces sp. NBC_01506 TaxID=2903887 RepID=UPI0038653665